MIIRKIIVLFLRLTFHILVLDSLGIVRHFQMFYCFI